MRIIIAAFQRILNRHLFDKPFASARSLRPLWASALAVGLATAAPIPLRAGLAVGEEAGKDNGTLTLAESALAKIAKADYAGAAQQINRALKTSPEDVNLHILAGALLLHTGDGAHARIAFQNALSCDPEDALARYGLGLTHLSNSDRGSALSEFARAERNGGDKSYLLLARRYAQWLGGAQVAIGGAALPDTLSGAEHALDGMSAMQGGDARRASEEMEQAQAALPGDPIVEPGGVLMTFEASHPLTVGANPLPNELIAGGLAAPLPAQKGLSGVVEVAPEDAGASVAYVSYELDGRSLGLVNTRPFALNFDTRAVANGWHTLSILLYDNQAVEMRRITRRIRAFNPQNGISAASERILRLRGGLWQTLALRPDRFACAYTLGLAQHKMGNVGAARHWFARACAVRPDSSDARRNMIACGGLAIGGEAMWGGLPDEKVVALTFDDGPKPGITEPLLELLTRMQVPATFFVIGRHVMEYPDLTRQIDASGMEIANHSYTHRNLTKLPPDEVAREVMQTQTAVQAVTGKTPRYLRPPGGNWNGSVANVVRAWGVTPCMWTVDVYGSEVIGAQQVADAVLAQVKPGSVILMHNGKLSTLQALPTVIKELKRRGYAFATVDALARRLAASRELARRTAAAYARTHHAE